MRRIAVFVVLSCLLPGCVVHQILREDEPATQIKAPAPQSSDDRSRAAGSSGPAVTGNRQQISETRKIAAFHKIEVDGAYHLTVTCQKDASLRVDAESNLLSANSDRSSRRYAAYLQQAKHPLRFTPDHCHCNANAFGADGERFRKVRSFERERRRYSADHQTAPAARNSEAARKISKRR